MNVFSRHTIFFIFSIFVFFSMGCENDVNEVQALGKKKNSIEEGTNISSFLSMDGKMKAHLTAPLLIRSQSADSGLQDEFPKTLHVDFYNDSAKIQSQLRAKYGRYFESQRKVYLRDSVVIFNTKGDTLFCEDLYWDQDGQKFYTAKKAAYSRNYRRTFITGIGMDAKQDMTNVFFYSILPQSYTYVKDSTGSGTATTPPADTSKKKN